MVCGCQLALPCFLATRTCRCTVLELASGAVRAAVLDTETHARAQHNTPFSCWPASAQGLRMASRPYSASSVLLVLVPLVEPLFWQIVCWCKLQELLVQPGDSPLPLMLTCSPLRVCCRSHGTQPCWGRSGKLPTPNASRTMPLTPVHHHNPPPPQQQVTGDQQQHRHSDTSACVIRMLSDP